MEEGDLHKAITLETYENALQHWPQTGQVILGYSDPHRVRVYQAYRKEIGEYAIKHQRFEGAPGWKEDRMTWVKPNFMWMMYRSKWGTSEGQEYVLAIDLRREFFHELVASAVESRVPQKDGPLAVEAWRSALRESEVRLQWDPDHDAWGECQIRRAIQLGIRGSVSRRYASGAEILRIYDMRPIVSAGREVLSQCGERHDEATTRLQIPVERILQ